MSNTDNKKEKKMLHKGNKNGKIKNETVQIEFCIYLLAFLLIKDRKEYENEHIYMCTPAILHCMLL